MRDLICERYEDGFRVRRAGEVLEVALLYPPYRDGDSPGKVRCVEVDMESTRASDSIRIHYDFERDGYVIQQASTFEWEVDDAQMDADWQEVAFIQAWGREKEDSALDVAPAVSDAPTGSS